MGIVDSPSIAHERKWWYYYVAQLPGYKAIMTQYSRDVSSFSIESHTITVEMEEAKVSSTKVDPTEVVLQGGTSTFYHALINCLSLLYGLGILSSPYAVAEAGWTGGIISLAIAFTYWYTASLNSYCMKVYPELRNYQDIAGFAFGQRGRVLVTTLFYLEIMGTLVGYSISMGDNLQYLFPDSRFSLPGITGKNFMILLSSLIILPSVWLRDLSLLSFTTIWCVLSSVVLLFTIFFSATVDHIGFNYPLPFIRLNGVPVAAGLYAFSYGGTAVFPTLYRSMKDPSKFPKVSVISFIVATASISGLGIAGATMFGPNTESQVTLSMPSRLAATKVVLWMTVVTPLTKYALILSPVTSELESFLPWNKSVPGQNQDNKTPTRKLLVLRRGVGTLMRSLVLACITIVAMTLPYFNYIVALIGSSMTIVICMILPCLFYLRLFHRSLSAFRLFFLLGLVTFGVFVGTVGTIASCHGLIKSKAGSAATHS